MADHISIANKMARDFLLSKNKKYALNKIIHELNFLVYSDTKEFLSYKAKSTILRRIFDVIAGRRIFPGKDQQNISHEFTDIIIFFEREHFITSQLKACLKHRSVMNWHFVRTR